MMRYRRTSIIGILGTTRLILLTSSFRTTPPPALHHHATITKRFRSSIQSSLPTTTTPPTNNNTTTRQSLSVLSRGPHHIIISKPPSVVCHHSEYTSSRANNETPLLQRLRDALSGRHVNLIHRLDRGASGALLATFADNSDDATAHLIKQFNSPTTRKTYVAFVRGNGQLRDTYLPSLGWFNVTRPIKDANGILRDATTHFRFVAGQDDPRCSVVLCRPTTGRWHQVRRHLNGLSHPILGDSSHGSSVVNREWREERGMKGERLMLHLARMEIEGGDDGVYLPRGRLDVQCPLEEDMRDLMTCWMGEVWEKGRDVLEEEGVLLEPREGMPMETLFYDLPNIDNDVIHDNKNNKRQDDDKVTILSSGEHYVVASKPPAVVCHHSSWTGTWTKNKQRRLDEPTPMLQRIRAAIGNKINLIHRLDRSASGCLICTIVPDNNNDDDDSNKNVARSFILAMQSPQAQKTYVALVCGNGYYKNDHLASRGWFTLSTPVKDENGKIIPDSITNIRYVAGNDQIGIVLARPSTGRWHQIRQHLRSIHHPILGDSSHGYNKINRQWKEKTTNGLLPQRTCLHLARVVLPPVTDILEDGLDVSCPLEEDLMMLLETHLEGVLVESRDLLEEEGVVLPR